MLFIMPHTLYDITLGGQRGPNKTQLFSKRALIQNNIPFFSRLPFITGFPHVILTICSVTQPGPFLEVFHGVCEQKARCGSDPSQFTLSKTGAEYTYG